MTLGGSLAYGTDRVGYGMSLQMKASTKASVSVANWHALTLSLVNPKSVM